MSEQAKIAYLQEKIKDAKSESRNDGIIAVAGMVASCLWLWSVADGLSVYLHMSIAIGYVLGICGIIVAIVGFVLLSHNEIQKINAMNELGKIARGSLKCPNCGKELLPDANLAFVLIVENHSNLKIRKLPLPPLSFLTF